MTTRDYAKTLEALSAYEIYPYASYLPSRSEYDGRFKRHRLIGHAKSALVNMSSYYGPKYPADAAIFQWDEQEHQWVQILKAEDGEMVGV